MDIKELTIDDDVVVRGIYELLLNAYPDSILPYLIYSDPNYVDYFHKLIKSSGDILYVSTDESVLYGFCHYKKSESKALLNNIVIGSDFRGQQIGKTLLKYSLQDIIQHFREIKEIELDVFSGNVPALKWYERIGFKIRNEKLWYSLTGKFINNSIKVKTPDLNDYRNNVRCVNDENGFLNVYIDSKRIASVINSNSLIVHDFETYRLYETDLIYIFKNRKLKYACLISEREATLPIIERSLRLSSQINSLIL